MNDKEEPIVICPHCKEYIIIKQLNCAIFRHGIFKENGNQIDPHSKKELCDYYVKENKIYGCGKPFRINIINNKFETEICEYI
jgi:hypothetical protein